MCDHHNVKCMECGEEGTPAHFLGTAKKTMTPAALAAKSINGAKGGWPKGKKRKPEAPA